MADERIVQYIVENRDRYSREALRQRLLEAGHDAAAVEAAFAAADAEGAKGSMDLRGQAAALVIVGYVGTFLVFALFSQRQFYGAVLAAFLTGGALLSLLLVALTPALRRAPAGRVLPALAAGLVAPLIILVGLAGLCVASVDPFTPY